MSGDLVPYDGDDDEESEEEADEANSRVAGWMKRRTEKSRRNLAESREAWRDWSEVQKERATYRSYERSAGGQARVALERGDTAFQWTQKVGAGGHGTEISAIEAEGWTLTDTTFITERTSTTNQRAAQDGSSGGAGSEVVTRSTETTTAIYAFRPSGTLTADRPHREPVWIRRDDTEL